MSTFANKHCVPIFRLTGASGGSLAAANAQMQSQEEARPRRWCAAVGIAALIVLTTGSYGSAQSYWGRQQCLNAAQICKDNCLQTLRGMCDSVRGRAWSSCYQNLQRRTHNCIYVQCSSEPCFRLR